DEQPRPQPLAAHLAVQLADELRVVPRHPPRVPGEQGAALAFAQRRVQLAAEVVIFELLLEGNEREVVVIVAYPELFTLLHAVYLLAQRLVVAVVEVYAAHEVEPVAARVAVAPHHAAQPGAQRDVFRRAYLVLQLVPEASG